MTSKEQEGWWVCAFGKCKGKGCKAWIAFWYSIPIGLFIMTGIYLFTEKLLASIVLGLGIYLDR